MYMNAVNAKYNQVGIAEANDVAKVLGS